MKRSGDRSNNPPITNSATAILSAWTALEVLSPFSFRREEDLAGGDQSLVASLNGRFLPWDVGERGRKNMKLYYQVVLGSVKLEGAVAKLLERYADRRPERPRMRGEAGLAVIILNRDGKPVDEPAVAISGFGWGVPRALNGDLADLADWRSKEKDLVEKLDRGIKRVDEKGELLPLDAVTIRGAFDWLVAELGLTSDLLEPPRFAIRSYEYYKNSDPPEPLLLNSFFLGDLAKASDLSQRRAMPSNLKRYLGLDPPNNRHDLLEDKAALSAAVSPGQFPAARWPGPGRYPLVLLQQAAVNLAIGGLRTEGILAVNGPPGTGKTTLLRDIVAAIVTARAEAMVTFADPAAAFEHSGQKLLKGTAWLHLYRLSSKLRGFEMVVASSNNKAVENVSAELPGLAAIAEDATELRYFSSLSNALRDRETWGLVAAVLGNAANRGRFRQTFWWDKEVGLSTYLAAAAGTPQEVEVVDPATGAKTTRPPRIVTVEQAPEDRQAALQRWKRACRAFVMPLQDSTKILQELESVRALVESLPQLEAAVSAARHRVESQRLAVGRAEAELDEGETAQTRAGQEYEIAKENRQHHALVRPGLPPL
jgi:hypothetical protein